MSHAHVAAPRSLQSPAYPVPARYNPSAGSPFGGPHGKRPTAEPRLFCVPPPPAHDESGPTLNSARRRPSGPWTVETAYRYCERMATTHYENFPVASRFLPSHLRPNAARPFTPRRVHRADDFADEPRYENRRVESLDRGSSCSRPVTTAT